MQGLFREQVLAAQRPHTLGAVRLAMPVSQQAWGIAAAVTSIAIVAWLCLGHYTRREHVAGSLVPQAGLLNVDARGAGVVSHLDARPGMHVRAGQALLTISGEQSSAALGDTGAVIAASLQQQRSELQATLAALPAQASAQAKDLHRRAAMLSAQAREIDTQLALERVEVGNATALIRIAQPLLQRGYVSTVEFDQYQANALNTQAQVKTLERQRLDTEQQASALQAQLAQLPLTTAATAHQLRGQLAQLAVSSAQNDVSRGAVLHAARAGIVTSVLIKPGQAVEPGEALLAILPDGSPLEAQLLVPSSAIGFVHAGTPVVLHYEAFPYQKFGVQRGTVGEVSRSALTPAQVTALLGQQPPPTPLYRVEVKLAAQNIDAYGQRQALLPGMSLDADLLLDHRRMIEWIFEPLYGMTRHGGGQS